MSMIYNLDIAKVDSVVEGGGAKTAMVSSLKTGRKTILKGLPENVELNKNTEINLNSSTNDYKNIDHLQIMQKDQDGNVTARENYERGENGMFKKQPQKQEKQAQKYPLTSDKTYSI